MSRSYNSYAYPGFDLEKWAEIEVRLGRTMDEIRHEPIRMHFCKGNSEERIGQPFWVYNPWDLRDRLRRKHGDHPFMLALQEDEMHRECVAAEHKEGDPRY